MQVQGWQVLERLCIVCTDCAIECMLYCHVVAYCVLLSLLLESESAEGKVQMNFPLDNEGAQVACDCVSSAVSDVWLILTTVFACVLIISFVYG